MDNKECSSDGANDHQDSTAGPWKSSSNYDNPPSFKALIHWGGIIEKASFSAKRKPGSCKCPCET